VRRLTLLALTLGFLLPAGVAQAAARGEKLSVGDPAPQLSIAKWLKGKKVKIKVNKSKKKKAKKSKKPGKVYVIEFWATWCGPCRERIPHMTALQRRYQDQGATVIGVTTEEENNTLDMVKAFVEEWGDKMDYTVAFDRKGRTYAKYMTAAGQTGIPTVFVIERTGHIAWIGSPFDGLDYVLEEIVSGRYDLETAKQVAPLERQVIDARMLSNWESMAANAEKWLELRPDDYRAQRYLLLALLPAALNQIDRARELADKLISQNENQPWVLNEIAQLLLSENNKQKMNDLSLAAVDRVLQKDPANVAARVIRIKVLAYADRRSEAAGYAKESLEVLKEDGRALGEVARILADPKLRNVYGDLAIQAIDMAAAADPEGNVSLLKDKFELLLAQRADQQQLEEMGRYLIEQASENAALLNEFAWGLLKDPPTKGRFNALALAAAERCDKASGGNNPMYLDTYAWAMFENGNINEAIRLEQKAISLLEDGNPAVMQFRVALRRFEKAKG
jgi:thiol-disulfide isomerase/thioredoxin/tetratricopeptide (TPR) repeat protein